MSIKKILSLCLIILIIILFYVFYKDQIIFDGAQSNFYKIYYYIIFLLILFFLILIFLKNKYTEYLLLIFTSIIIGFYIAEFYLTYKYDLPNRNLNHKNAQNINLSFIKELKNKKFTIFRVFPSTNLEKKNKFYPLSGISYSKTIHCNENGYFSNYESDRYGFNNPDDEWDATKIKFLLIGDSYVHGACVNRPDDISSNLRNLSKANAINLGYSGNGPLLQYATLLEYGFKKIENILWFYFEGNDLSDLKKEIKSSLLIKYLKNDNFTQNLKLRQNEVDDFSKKYLIENNSEIIKYYENSISKINKKVDFNNNFLPKIIKFLKITNLRERLFVYKNNESDFENFKNILKKTKKFSIKKKANLYFIYVPEYNRYKTSYKNNSYKKILQIVDKLNIDTIDLHQEFFTEQKNVLKFYPFSLHGHFNEYGYQAITKYIYNKINK